METLLMILDTLFIRIFTLDKSKKDLTTPQKYSTKPGFIPIK